LRTGEKHNCMLSLVSPIYTRLLCVQIDLPGQWFFQLFNSSTTCPPPPPELQCLAYVRNTIDLTEYTLQACPCNGRLAASDPRFRFTYIDWFRYCFSYNIPSQAASGRLSFTQVEHSFDERRRLQIGRVRFCALYRALLMRLLNVCVRWFKNLNCRVPCACAFVYQMICHLIFRFCYAVKRQ
jgi:hypothetical protein